jgi:hypothetical protein
VKQIFTTGDTIRLKARIKDYAGNLIDPDTLTFSMYQLNEEPLWSEEVDLVKNKITTGEYYFDVIAEEGTFIFEWHAVKNDKPYKKRDTIQSNFLGYW